MGFPFSVKLNATCEKVFELEFCTISFYSPIHVHEDVLNFGATDSFWGATLEKIVKKYIDRPTNRKALKKTYAQSEERRELLNSKVITHNKTSFIGKKYLFSFLF